MRFSGDGRASARQDRFDAGDLAAQYAQARRVLQLTALLLDTQIEHLMLQLAAAAVQLFIGQFAKFFDLHGGWECVSLGVRHEGNYAA